MSGVTQRTPISKGQRVIEFKIRCSITRPLSEIDGFMHFSVGLKGQEKCHYLDGYCRAQVSQKQWCLIKEQARTWHFDSHVFPWSSCKLHSLRDVTKRAPFVPQSISTAAFPSVFESSLLFAHPLGMLHCNNYGNWTNYAEY